MDDAKPRPDDSQHTDRPRRGAGLPARGGRKFRPAEAPPAARPAPAALSEDWDDVLAVIKELEEQLDRYDELREALQRELAEVSAQHQSAEQRGRELEAAVAGLRARIEADEQLRHELVLLEEELADVNTRLQRTSSQLVAAQRENARLSDQFGTANKQLEELPPLRAERDKLRSELKDGRARVDQLERENRELTELRNSLQSKLDQAQQWLEESRAAAHQAQMSLRAAEDRSEEARRIQAALEERIDALKAENKQLQAQTLHLQREIARQCEQQHFYERELTTLRTQSQNAEAELAQVRRAFSEVRNALAETRARARRRKIDSAPPPAAEMPVSAVLPRAADGPQPTTLESPPAVVAATDEPARSAPAARTVAARDLITPYTPEHWLPREG